MTGTAVTFGGRDWLRLETERLLLLIDADAAPRVVDRAREGLDDGLGEVLDALVSRGFHRMPDFLALERADGGLRVLGRGPLHARTRAGEASWSLDGLVSWSERIVASGEIEVAGERTPWARVALGAAVRELTDEEADGAAVAASPEPEPSMADAAEAASDEREARQGDATQGDATKGDATKVEPAGAAADEQPSADEATVAAESAEPAAEEPAAEAPAAEEPAADQPDAPAEEPAPAEDASEDAEPASADAADEAEEFDASDLEGIAPDILEMIAGTRKIPTMAELLEEAGIDPDAEFDGRPPVRNVGLEIMRARQQIRERDRKRERAKREAAREKAQAERDRERKARQERAQSEAEAREKRRAEVAAERDRKLKEFASGPRAWHPGGPTTLGEAPLDDEAREERARRRAERQAREAARAAAFVARAGGAAAASEDATAGDQGGAADESASPEAGPAGGPAAASAATTAPAAVAANADASGEMSERERRRARFAERRAARRAAAAARAARAEQAGGQAAPQAVEPSPQSAPSAPSSTPASDSAPVVEASTTAAPLQAAAPSAAAGGAAPTPTPATTPEPAAPQLSAPAPLGSAPAASKPAPAPADDPSPYDFLFGSTVTMNEVSRRLRERSEARAADSADDASAAAPAEAAEPVARPVAQTPADPPTPPAPAEPSRLEATQAQAQTPVPADDSPFAGDHDGSTVLAAELRAWRASPGRHAAPAISLGSVGAFSAGRTFADADSDAHAAPPVWGPGAADGDHDGHTVRTESIAELRRRAAETSAAAAQAAAPQASGPAPTAPTEAGTTAPITVIPEAPELAVVTSTGVTTPLEGVIVYGRAPRADHPGVLDGLSGELARRDPRTVVISGSTDISRNHVRVSLEGGAIIVTDLHSRNGTDIVLPGRSAQRLRAGEPTAVLPGTVVDLGDGITLRIGG
ncbi:hypothetical protein USB125703_01167 [Pseudoclavibacter triregionum]|nr:hypothetical protein USB125703_01167 [Pseudoclavibacter triregionum]